MNNSTTKLLIFDIDETLVHTYDPELNYSIVKNLLSPHFNVLNNQHSVIKRPHVHDILSWALGSNLFKCAIYSAAGIIYIDDILINLLGKNYKFNFEFIFDSDKCTRKWSSPDLDVRYEGERFYQVKSVKKVERLGFKKENVLFLDNSKRALQLNYGNHVHIKSFYGSGDDIELLKVQPFIEKWFESENIRTIDKRGWDR